MEKTYPIIKVGDYLYAVDKEGLNSTCPYIQNGKEVHSEGSESHGICDCVAIIATNNPSLKGVLQLPPIEEDIYQFSREALPMQIDDDDKTKHRIEERRYGFQIGYKAAQAKGKEGIESLLEALNLSAIQYSKARKWQISLSKVPKAIEVEMEQKNFSYSGAFKAAMDAGEEMEVPKSNNNIIVGRYIYE